MAYSKWNEKSLGAYDAKVTELIAHYTEHPELCTIHFGTSNRKTKMLNEGTSAGLAGTCDCSCKGDCREGCYAIVHGDGIYQTARVNHAQNTIMRRRSPMEYYRRFFAYARTYAMNLRINETGDFENEEQVRAFIANASESPEVKVIGYTKRMSLLPIIAEANRLPNVSIHFSVACNGNGKKEAEAAGVYTASITFDPEKGNCPNQIAKIKKTGVEWHCAMCAEKGVGCFAKKDIYFIAH